jgi:hypothetical protein
MAVGPVPRQQDPWFGMGLLVSHAPGQTAPKLELLLRLPKWT